MQRTPPDNKIHSVCNSDSETFKHQNAIDKKKSAFSKRQKRRRASQEEDSCKSNEERSQSKDEILSIIDAWKKEQECVLKKLSDDINEVKKQNANIQKTNIEIRNTNSEIEKSFNFLSQKYEDLKILVGEMQKDRKKTLEYVKTLEDQIETIQRAQKSNMIELRNIPSKAIETSPDLASIVTKTCKSLDVPIQRADIKETVRIYNKHNPQSAMQTVLVDFSSSSIKNNLLAKVKDYNKKNPNNKFSSHNLDFPGPNVPIYITESLTPKSRKLFYLTRIFAKNRNYKFCWTSNGRIFLRKTDGAQHILIKDEAQLRGMNDAPL
ncbi:unnamed protein product [Colias eurytheme]|nr:unnamed protein product [Colias eurytheme]